MSIHIVEIAQPSVIDTVAVAQPSTVAIVEIRQGPAGTGGVGSVAWDDLTGTASDVPFEPVTAPAYSEGLVFYDSTDKSLTYYNDEADVSMNIGRELWVRVRNDSGSPILNGKVVYINDAVGQLPTIRLARADSATTSRVIGIATHDIGNNEFGYVTTVGEVKGLNTSDFQDGDLLFLSATTAGDMTTTAPLAPNRVIQVATVLHAHITQGKLYCHPETDSIPSTGIVDSTSTGRALITAASASAARTTLELGTLATQSATITDYLTIASASATYAAKGANTDITKLTGIGAGTVSAPFLTWGDADSGFYGTDTKSIAYAYDGVQKFRFDSSGMTVSSAGGAATRTFAVFDGSGHTFNAGLSGASTQVFGFGDLTGGTIGRFERSTSTGLISFQMQGAASASTTFNIGHQDASFRIRGAASQSAALQEWRNSSEAVLASINSDGSASVKGLTTAGPVSLLKSGSSDLFSFDFLNVYFAPGSALEFRTKLGSGATGDALFTAATPAAARTTLELGNLATLNGPLAVASGGTGTTNGSITGTGALTFTAGGSNQNINLTPSGTGIVRVTKASGQPAFQAIGASNSYPGFYAAINGEALSRVGIELDGSASNKGALFFTDGTTKSLGLSMISSGVLGIGSGAANSFAGSLKATNAEFIGNATVAGNVGIGTTSPSALLDVNSNTVRVRTARTPASATATGNAGDICWDANYIYVCTATNTWKRTAISTWP